MSVDPPLFSSVCLVFVVAIFTFGAAAVICQLKDSFTIFPLPLTAGSVARSTVEVKKIHNKSFTGHTNPSDEITILTCANFSSSFDLSIK